MQINYFDLIWYQIWKILLLKGVKFPRKKSFFGKLFLTGRILLVLVLLSALVKRYFVSCMQDFLLNSTIWQRSCQTQWTFIGRFFYFCYQYVFVISWTHQKVCLNISPLPTHLFFFFYIFVLSNRVGIGPIGFTIWYNVMQNFQLASMQLVAYFAFVIRTIPNEGDGWEEKGGGIC